MFDPTPSVRRLAEAELKRAELQSRQLVSSLAFYGVAFLIGCIALVMLSLAGFFALDALYGAPIAALIVGAVLSVIAGIAFVMAARGPSRSHKLEMQLATQAIEHARNDIEKDFGKLERDIDRMTLGLLGFVKGKGGTPLFTLLIGGLAAWSPMLRSFLLPFLRR